ncbi:MAG: CAP domain-containing protein [Patescibacteria group bacterium]|nr:CAP domain-containing protein [Patescibacteria group bacterium]
MADKIFKNIQLVREKSRHYFRHYVIPYEGNRFRPKILGANSLRFYSILLIVVKVAVTGFLFISYPSQGQFASFTAGQIVDLTNVERQKNGLSNLSQDSKLAQAAQKKAQDMLANGYFDHTSPDGKKPWDWISAVGYNYIYAGENLAKDFTNASSTVTALMNSASHRKNILNDKYQNIGVAVVDGTMNGKQTVVMVQFFGSLSVPEKPATQVAKTAEPAKTTEPSNNKPPSQKPPVTQPTQPAKTEPAPVIYAAELTGQSSDTLQLASGVSTTIWAEFKNTGNVTWKNSGTNFIALNVTDPSGRVSPFQHVDWVESYRPMVMKSSEVKSGSTERFEFAIQAPQEPGTYEEHFALVAENLTWIEGGTFKLPIIVSTPSLANTNQSTNQAVAGSSQEPTEPISNPPASEPSAATTITPEGSTLAQEVTVQKNTGTTSKIIFYSQRFFLVLLIFLMLALLINIFVNIKVQHYPTVFRTLLVIVLAGLLYFTRIHYIELVGNYMNII